MIQFSALGGAPKRGNSVRLSLVSLICIVFAWAGSSHAQRPLPAPLDKAVVAAARADLAAAEQHLADNEIAAADHRFDKVIASPGFSALEPAEQYLGLLRAGIAALDSGQAHKAHGLLVSACAFDQSDGIAWHLRLRAAYALNDYVDSAGSVRMIAQRWPNSLDQIREQAIFNISRRLDLSRANRDERIAMLIALFDANWTNEGVEPNELWFDLVRFLIDNESMPRATEVAARIDSPSIVLTFRVDKRFDGLTRARVGGFDIRRTMKRQRDHIDELRKRHPERLSYLGDELELDIRDGHAERALEQADKVIARVAAEGTSVYSDTDDFYIWILDARSRALQRLGRWEDAVTQQRKAARRPENGGLNVSQSLNLARLLARLGRADEVEEAMDELGLMSPFGRMQLALNRVIAATVKGDQTVVEAQLEIMRAERIESMAAYQAALVQAGRIDAAASLLVERLRSEDWRNGALSEVQTYIEVAEAPRDTLHMQRWREILARKDVRKALDAVGRIERVPFEKVLL
ncbi:MAG: hypothetical protein BGP25_13900 [Lysobacterales bacterium 63-13]|nr:MAG: hypothetical protein BGP25_13900 [Xanthomonadales bacterium 63-13]